MKKKLNNDKNIFLLLTVLLLMQTIISCTESKKENHSTNDTMQMNENKVYTCPMHPEIIRNKPGKCPICKMDLVLKNPEETTKVDLKMDDLIKPVDQYVISSITTIHPEEKEISILIKANGFITYDTRSFSSIASRYEGRVEKLFLKYNFQKIEKGQKLFDIYSPELLTAEQNLIFLLKNDKENKILIEGSKQKLNLMGMTSTQIEELVSTQQARPVISVYSPVSGYIVEEEVNRKMQKNATAMGESNNNQQNYITKELSIKEGQYLSKGQSVFKIVNNTNVWAHIKLLGNQITNIKKDDAIKIKSQNISNSVTAKVDFIQPTFNESENYLTIRSNINNANNDFKIGDLIEAEINKKTKKALWINKEALIDLGSEKVVLLKTNNNLLKVKKVSIGTTINNWVEITDGITSDDIIAQNAQFLIDSESFIKQ